MVSLPVVIKGRREERKTAAEERKGTSLDSSHSLVVCLRFRAQFQSRQKRITKAITSSRFRTDIRATCISEQRNWSRDQKVAGSHDLSKTSNM